MNSGISRFRRLHRDSRAGLIMGVCAGIADDLGWDRTVLRIVMLIGLFVAFVPVVLVYLAAGMKATNSPTKNAMADE